MAAVDVDVACPLQSPAAAMHAVVVGTVMVDPVLIALRRVAQEAESWERSSAGGYAARQPDHTASRAAQPTTARP